jgi:antitoxin ParD1/3/4
MPTRNVNLTDHYDQFVQELVASGKFKNASEVMRAGLHLLEQRTCEERQKIALLRALVDDGFEALDQGRGIVVDTEAKLSRRIAAIGRRAAKRVAQPKTRR